MVDRYDSFQKLQCGEIKGVDYDIRLTRRQSSVAIIAPHGGEIEPCTTLVAEAIAKDDYNFYSLIGLKPNRPHGDLHITSTKFDEPECVRLIAGCNVVVAIHGRKDRDDPQTVWLGGRDTALRDAIIDALKATKFKARLVDGSLAAKNRSNICNRGKRAEGVQLELPRTLRDELQNNPSRLHEFSDAIRGVIDFSN